MTRVLWFGEYGSVAYLFFDPAGYKGWKREFLVPKSPFSMCSLVEERGFFDRKLPFPERGKWEFWTPKPSFSGNGDSGSCQGNPNTCPIGTFHVNDGNHKNDANGDDNSHSYKSETGRIRFRRVRFQAPNSVSFAGLTEFRGANSAIKIPGSLLFVCQSELTKFFANSPSLP